jgi:hypothetical protein
MDKDREQLQNDNRSITLDEDSLLPLSAHTCATGSHHPKDQPH